MTVRRAKLFRELEEINKRPRPFEFYTAADLWTDEHISSRMLAFHLDQDADISSRNARFIDRSVEWITSRFQVGKDTKVADFGCGPGLYANRLAKRGATVTGIDFSARSIEHAKKVAAQERVRVDYVIDDYLDFQTEDRFDIVLMIMCDFCALSPEQRRQMLRKFHTILKSGGSVLLDVYSMMEFDRIQEATKYAANMFDGFWSANRYFCFKHIFKYPDAKVVLEKYTIVEPRRTRTVYNWFQHFSPEDLKHEFMDNGLSIDEVYADVTGSPYDPTSGEFAVVAGK